ncbi:hypothetical protein P3L10_031120 [Capsicum annuum]
MPKKPKTLIIAKIRRILEKTKMKSEKSFHEEEEQDVYDVGSNGDATPSSNNTKGFLNVFMLLFV